jgi:hypothetical protein
MGLAPKQVQIMAETQHWVSVSEVGHLQGASTRDRIAPGQPSRGIQKVPRADESIAGKPHGIPGDLLAWVCSTRNDRGPIKAIFEYLRQQDENTAHGFWNTGAALSLLFADFLPDRPENERDLILAKHLGVQIATAKDAQRVFDEYRGDQDQYLRHGIALAKELSGRGFTWRTREELHELDVSGVSEMRPASAA